MKQAILYYSIRPLLWAIQWLPRPLFYGLCSMVYFLIYRLLGYRKKVVRRNLENAFPEKSIEERKKIEKDFYRYLADLSLETFRSKGFSKKRMLRNCKAIDPEITIPIAKQHKSFIIALGHFGNWEWAAHTAQLAQQTHHVYIVYKPLSNPYFERFMKKIREHFGARVVPMQSTYRTILKNKGHLGAYALVGDQLAAPETAHWMTFLNQETACYNGIEKIARGMDMPVVYVSVQREGRGRYTVHSELLIDQPKAYEEGVITQAFMRRLEEDIQEMPHTWLWTHKRWKHQRPEGKQLYQEKNVMRFWYRRNNSIFQRSN